MRIAGRKRHPYCWIWHRLNNLYLIFHAYYSSHQFPSLQPILLWKTRGHKLYTVLIVCIDNSGMLPDDLLLRLVIRMQQRSMSALSSYLRSTFLVWIIIIKFQVHLRHYQHRFLTITPDSHLTNFRKSWCQGHFQFWLNLVNICSANDVTTMSRDLSLRRAQCLGEP